jgi:mono/diheme cytochrome c family protein
MYYPVALEGYSQVEYNKYFPYRMNLLKPVAGTIAQGRMDYVYNYPDTPEGYDSAGKYLKNPLPYTEEVLKEGERLYGLYCQHCHGAEGDGKGTVPELSGQKYPNPPAYTSAALKNLPEGKIYHTLMYGKNKKVVDEINGVKLEKKLELKNMGSHASQLTPTDRWHLVRYVQKLQGHIQDNGQPTPPDSTQAPVAAPKDEKGGKPAAKKVTMIR